MGMDLGEILWGSEGQEGAHGVDVQYLDRYGDADKLRGNLINYWGGLLKGDEPGFLDEYIPSLQKTQEGQLEREFFGQGNRRQGSIMDKATNIGASKGVGKKPTVNLQKGVVGDFGQKRMDLANFYNNYRAEFMANAQGQASAGLAGLPRTPEYTSSAFSYAPAAGSPGMLQEFTGGFTRGLAGGSGSNVTGSPYTSIEASSPGQQVEIPSQFSGPNLDFNR